VEGVHGHSTGVGTGWSASSLPTQTILQVSGFQMQKAYKKQKLCFTVDRYACVPSEIKEPSIKQQDPEAVCEALSTLLRVFALFEFSVTERDQGTSPGSDEHATPPNPRPGEEKHARHRSHRHHLTPKRSL